MLAINSSHNNLCNPIHLPTNQYSISHHHDGGQQRIARHDDDLAIIGVKLLILSVKTLLMNMTAKIVKR